MSVVCPGCGTLVEDGAAICPACHHSLREWRTGDDKGDVGDNRWCGSCGSPIPEGHDACPVCGMPAEGAFDEENEPSYAITEPLVPMRKERDVKLESAIPPEPQSGEKREGADEHRKRMRLLLISAVAAIVLVGGTTLYIARPWDPEAYSTHATEDADTSMEGFPGEKPYLSSQDLAEENRYRTVVSDQQQRMDSLYDRMGELAAGLQSSYDDLSAYSAGGSYRKEESQLDSVADMCTEIRGIADEYRQMDLLDPTFEERRNSCVVLADYLSGAAEVLVDAWKTFDKATGSSSFVTNVRSVLAGEGSDYGFEQWMALFQNAYRS